MLLHAGETTTVQVAFVADYACWGRTAGGEVGMIPLEEEDFPEVGQRLRVRVVRLLDPVGQEQHSDMTYDGRIRRVDFLGSLEPI